MRRTRTVLRLGAVLAFGAMLGGCADIYYDRRDSVSFHAGDAVETNKVAHIIDPWPKAAANRNIEYDGQRMQRAIERYRTNKTTPLQTTSTSSVQYQQPSTGGNSNASP
jgi:hypothetical protein